MVRYQISRALLAVENKSSEPTSVAAGATNVSEYSDVVIIFTCLLCALICVVGVLGVVRWTCLKRPISSTTSTANVVEVPNDGLKKKIVESLPRLIFKSNKAVTTGSAASSADDAGQAECVICLSEFKDGEEIRVLPGCNHVYHVGCIDTWLIGSPSFCCPSCRQVIVVRQCHKCKIHASVTQQPADYLP